MNLKKLLCCLGMVVSYGFAFAGFVPYDRFRVGDFIYKILYSPDYNEVEVSGYAGKETSPVIPGKVIFNDKEYDVIAIESNAFYFNQTITHISIPPTIKYIEIHAFLRCNSLVSVSLPESLNELGREAFKECENLTTINIPENLTEIKNGTFYGCKSLSSIKFSEGIKTISSEAFGNCTGLKEVKLPESLENLNEYAFKNCENLESVYIPQNVAISPLSFYNCFELTNFIVDDENSYYSSVGGILYNRDKSSIYNYPSARGSVIIPSGVREIGKYVFAYNTDINRVEIPSTVENIEDGAFYCCDSIREMICYAERPPKLGTNAFNLYTRFNEDVKYLDCIFYVPDIYLEEYKRARIWKYQTILPISLLGEGAGVNIGENIGQNLIYVYSLDGKLVSKTTERESLSSLPAGLYIINGKKVLVK